MFHYIKLENINNISKYDSSIILYWSEKKHL